MKDSTVDDIMANYDALHVHAEELTQLHKTSTDMDWWDTFDIGNLQFDFNVFDWEDEDGKPIVVVAVHPVSWNDEGYGSADMSNFVRILVTTDGVFQDVPSVF